MSIVFDIAVVAIVALLVFLGFHRGFVRTVFNLVGYILAAVLAFFISSPISVWIFQTFFRSKAVDLISGELAKATQGMDLNQMVQQAIGAIPENLKAFVPDGAIATIENGLSAAPTTAEVANTVVDQLVGPIAEMVIQLLLFVILFLILCIVVKIITRMLKFIDKIPFVGTANSVLGLFVGLAEAVVFLFFFTSIVAMIIQLSGNQWDAVNQSVVDQSYIFKFIYEYNPLTQIN